MINEPSEQVHRDNLAQAVKSIPKPKGSRMDKIRSIVLNHQCSRVEGLLVDGVTANMLVNVYEALNETNRKSFESFSLRKMVSIGWKLVKK